MGLEEIRTVYPDRTESPQRSCTLCGGPRIIKAEFKFKTGTTAAPAVGATITCGTSGDTGVVESVELYSGAWASNTAAGYINMTSPTGLDDDGYWGEDAETATYSGGSVVLDGNGYMKAHGLLYPESDMIKFRGKWYCRPHFEFRWRQKLRDERKFKLEEFKADE